MLQNENARLLFGHTIFLIDTYKPGGCYHRTMRGEENNTKMREKADKRMSL